MATPQKSDQPDPVVIRQRLHDVLAKAKSAHTMPWNENDAGVWTMIFPNMANWLPEEEANKLRLEFAQEMQRLLASQSGPT